MGYSTTHVANGYFEPIYVKVDVKELTSQEMSIGVGVGYVSASATIKSTYGNFITAGFAKVLPLDFVGISPDGSNVYVSIWCLSQGYIWQNIQQQGDISFIVDINGGVMKAKYGSIWNDENGNDIKPSQTEVDQAAIAQEAKTSSSGTSNRFVKTYFWAVQMCLTLILLAHFC